MSLDFKGTNYFVKSDGYSCTAQYIYITPVKDIWYMSQRYEN